MEQNHIERGVSKSDVIDSWQVVFLQLEKPGHIEDDFTMALLFIKLVSCFKGVLGPLQGISKI